MIDVGWSAVYRKIWENPIFKGRADRVGAWLWMIHTAAFKSTTQDANGITVYLERGQMCASRKQISDGTGLSEKEVRNLLDCLERASGVRREYVGGRAKGRSIITICNYEEYQPEKLKSGQASGQARAKRGPTKEQINKPSSLRSEGDVDASATAKASRGHRIPEDWTPRKNEIDFAQSEHDLTIQEIADASDEFKDYWLSEAGSKARKLNWDITFRNRIRERASVIKRRRNAPRGKHSGGNNGEPATLAQELARRRGAGGVAPSEPAGRGFGNAGEETELFGGSGLGATVIDASAYLDNRRVVS